MTPSCTVRQRRRALRAAELIRDRELDAAVAVIEPSSSALDRWTIAITIPRANTLAPGVLRALSEAGAALRRLGGRDDTLHAVATV